MTSLAFKGAFRERGRADGPRFEDDRGVACSRHRFQYASATLAVVFLQHTACGPSRPRADAPMIDAAPDRTGPISPRGIDILVVMDNSAGMDGSQRRFMTAFDEFLPRVARAAGRVHVGVISSDLGTPGTAVAGCANPDGGDDGRLNPIRFGGALSRSEAPAAEGLRPDDCTTSNILPPFLAFESDQWGQGGGHDFRCTAGLSTSGCVVEQPLEAIRRALIAHDASDRPGNTDPNAGFLREDALLALIVLTDEDDGSVRDCRFAEEPDCENATDVYNVASPRWPSPLLNLRFYAYQPGNAGDPTWGLGRYYTLSDPTSRGFLHLKRLHPERVLFAAIAGVPNQIPIRAGNPDQVDWDQLLGAPIDPDSPDQFIYRTRLAAIDGASPEGPISMLQGNIDPECPERPVPACRQEGTTAIAGNCSGAVQYFALPSRRIVEVARRFDERYGCSLHGTCHNGFIGSICANDYGSTLRKLASRIETIANL